MKTPDKNGVENADFYAMPGILVVEDDENLNRGITFSLKNPDMRFFQQNQ